MTPEVVKQWLDRAEADYKAALILIDAEPLILDIACFHLQQAAEKQLKALLVYKDIDFPFTHDLEYLAEQCATLEGGFRDFDFGRLTMFAARARYPHDHVAPSMAEINEYVDLVTHISGLVRSMIGVADR